MRKFPRPRQFIPKNPQKYAGDPNNIVCRSGIELRYFKYFDEHPNVLKYASEEIHIKYLHPIDRKMHRYFPDFMVQILGADGKKRNFLIEIKSSSDTVAPVKGKKRAKTFLSESITWSINQAKWAAARAFCAKYNMTFLVLTEKEIKRKWQ